MAENAKKILIVEDDEELIEAMKDRFEQEGFVVITAVNGEEGVKTAKAKHPDLILLDVMMPKLNGMEALAQLRQDSWGKDVPVFVLTALDAEDKRREAAQMGADYIVKSATKLKGVVEKVKEQLGIA